MKIPRLSERIDPQRARRLDQTLSRVFHLNRRIIFSLLAFGLALSSRTAAALTVTYSASSEDFANPERGLLMQQVVWPDQTGTLNFTRSFPTQTIVWVYFRLDNYRTRDLDAAGLARITDAFTATRDANLKIVARFTYNFTMTAPGNDDATITQVKRHINQLAPILQANADVLLTLQAGFAGAWGEWHDSTNGLVANSTVRKDLIDALLAALPAGRTLQIRYPRYKHEIYGDTLTASNAFTNTPVARIGHHNDCFLADFVDYGTYLGDCPLAIDCGYVYDQTMKDLIAKEGQYTPVGGETCTLNPPRTDCPTATAELEMLHWSFLNNGFNTDVLNSWVSGGCMETVKRRLGYRLALSSATIPQSVQVGGYLDANLVIDNLGYAAMFNARPAYLVLYNGTQRYDLLLSNVDPRFWGAGKRQTVIAHAQLPATMATGSYKLGIWLPDAAAGLSANPAYAVQFANTGVWDATTGINILSSSVNVTRPAAPAAPKNLRQVP